MALVYTMAKKYAWTKPALLTNGKIINALKRGAPVMSTQDLILKVPG